MRAEPSPVVKPMARVYEDHPNDPWSRKVLAGTSPKNDDNFSTFARKNSNFPLRNNKSPVNKSPVNIPKKPGIVTANPRRDNEIRTQQPVAVYDPWGEFGGYDYQREDPIDHGRSTYGAQSHTEIKKKKQKSQTRLGTSPKHDITLETRDDPFYQTQNIASTKSKIVTKAFDYMCQT